MTSAGLISVLHQLFLDGQQDRVLKIEDGWTGSFGQIIIFLQPFSDLQSYEFHFFSYNLLHFEECVRESSLCVTLYLHSKLLLFIFYFCLMWICWKHVLGSWGTRGIRVHGREKGSW